MRSWQTGLSRVKTISFGVPQQLSVAMDELFGPNLRLLSHIINKHSSLDDPLFNKCGHGEIHPRRWLQAGMLLLRNSPLEEKQSALVHVFHST